MSYKVNRHKQYERIRFLIELYYSGETSPEQETEIFEFYRQCNLKLLPEDLRREADMFGIMPIIGRECTDAKLLKEIEREIKREHTPAIKRYYRFVGVVAVASVALLLVVMGAIFISRYDEIYGTEDTPLIVRADTVCKSGEVAKPVHIEPAPQVAAIVIMPEKKVKKTTATSPAKTHDAGSEVREITDSAEAARYIAHINEILNETSTENKRLQHKVSLRLTKADDNIRSKMNNI